MGWIFFFFLRTVTSRDQPVCVLSSVRISLLWMQPVRVSAPSPHPAARPASQAAHRTLGAQHAPPRTQHPDAEPRLRTCCLPCERTGARPRLRESQQLLSGTRCLLPRPSTQPSSGPFSLEGGPVPSPPPSPSPSWCRARCSSRSCCPPACWPRCFTCRRPRRPTPRRAPSAEAKGRSAQVGAAAAPAASSR